MQTYIVIPAYNVEKWLDQVIEGLLRLGYNNIIVVNDASTDSTAEIIARHPVISVEHLVNLGQGAALATGTRFALEAGADIIVHFDGDGQHCPEDIALFEEKIAAGFDTVFGSRFQHTEQQIPWTKKFFILKPAIFVNWFFSGINLTDAHNGFRALSRAAAEKINISQDRMAHATEIPAEVVRQKLSYTEVPVKIIYHHYGQNFRGGLRIIWDLVKEKILS